jgi:hypothetical protein
LAKETSVALLNLSPSRHVLGNIAFPRTANTVGFIPEKLSVNEGAPFLRSLPLWLRTERGETPEQNIDEATATKQQNSDVTGCQNATGHLVPTSRFGKSTASWNIVTILKMPTKRIRTLENRLRARIV